MTADMASVIELPPDARGEIRRHLGLGETDTLRISYIPGPGDVFGTFEHWQAGRHDPRVPIIAYSLMFYELMRQMDAQCQIIALHPVGTVGGPEGDRFRFEQLETIPVRGRWSWLRSQRKLARDTVSMVRAFDPHIVVTSTHNPPASWGGLSKGRKLILSAHNSFWPMGHPPRDIKGRIRRALLAKRARALDGAICTSHECARQIAELTGGRIRGEVECPQVVAQYPIQQRDSVRRILFLGRIEESKGVFLLIEVAERLMAAHADLVLVVAGAGNAEPSLRARVRTSPYRGRIDILGHLDSNGVHSALAATDLLVCPTMTNFNEGLAVVGFEAAAHGIPTLLSSVVPAADLLGESCLVFEADSPAALERVLSGMIADPATYRSLCAATAGVRIKIGDRALSWGSALCRAMNM